MARLITDHGATPFIDLFDVAKGDRIEARIKDGLKISNELVALITPWSVNRNWVWSEMAGAWALDKRFLAVLYGVTLDEIDRQHGGLAMMQPINIATIDEFDQYLQELAKRGQAADPG